MALTALGFPSVGAAGVRFSCPLERIYAVILSNLAVVRRKGVVVFCIHVLTTSIQFKYVRSQFQKDGALLLGYMMCKEI